MSLNFIFKRTFDVIVSGVGLVLLAPVMAIAAVAVRIDTPGPILFRQPRVGRFGQPFTINKFRTMVVRSAKAGQEITLYKDPRVTRTGAFLRRWKLDELPQLWNVFRGDMSLVGPRPEVPKYVALYPQHDREILLSVRPGITDLASIKYRSEAEMLANVSDPERFYREVIIPDKLAMGVEYARTVTLPRDIAIILQTLLTVARGTPSSPSANSIVVFRPAGLGDFIISTPALVRLRKFFPEARITLVTMHSQDAEQAAKVSAYAGGARVAPWVELVRPHAIDEVCLLPSVRDFETLREARRIMARFKPDLVVQMFDPGTPYRRRALKMIFMAALCGPVRQLGWKQRGQINTERPPRSDPHLGHHIQGPLQFIRELEGRSWALASDVEFDVRPGAEAEAWAEKWISEQGLQTFRTVAVAPGAIHEHKQWPVEKFAALIRELAEIYTDVKFLIVGTRKDSCLAAQLIAASPGNVIDVCGSSIAQSAALFRRCDLVVGNDGGAMHLADAMGALVVSIVPGIEFPVSIEPWHNQDRVVRHPVSCAPCYGFTSCREGHRKCMMDLPVAAVLKQCIRALPFREAEAINKL